jgi:hypothetical protein
MTLRQILFWTRLGMNDARLPVGACWKRKHAVKENVKSSTSLTQQKAYLTRHHPESLLLKSMFPNRHTDKTRIVKTGDARLRGLRENHQRLVLLQPGDKICHKAKWYCLRI